MYLKQTSSIISDVQDAQLRPKLSYFIYNESSVWENYIDEGVTMRIQKGNMLKYDPNYVYFLRSGLLQFSRSINKNMLPIFYLGKNSLCFEMHIIGHTALPSHYHAIEDAALVRFPIRFIRNLIEEKPELSYLIMESIGVKYSALLTRINEMGTHDLLRNIARLLLDMAAYNKFAHTFTPAISQRELVEFFSVHRSSVNRSISILRDKKIIGNYTKNRIEILDYSMLIDIAAVIYA